MSRCFVDTRKMNDSKKIKQLGAHFNPVNTYTGHKMRLKTQNFTRGSIGDVS